MGKKTRKTRWRTLSIEEGHQSDTDSVLNENGLKLDSTGECRGRNVWQQQQPRYHHNNSNNPKYNSHFSSHSTPTRQQSTTNTTTSATTNGYHHHHNNHHHYHNNHKYQTSKSTTRSSSTVSENKITFNEDEYTRITTPRQDVLFKKGYLSKPKPYLNYQQPQPLTSTGNSTGDGTPDHHSADGTETDYEAQPPNFVFPGSYLDHNAPIYYVNGFDPAYPAMQAPMMVYNPMCYPPYMGALPPRVKRYSTDSMTESMSPTNEPHDGTSESSEFIPPTCIVYTNGYPPPVYSIPSPGPPSHSDPDAPDATESSQTTEDLDTTTNESPAKPETSNSPLLTKKRRRRKSESSNPETDSSVLTDSVLESSDDTPVADHSATTNETESTNPPSSTSTPIKYRVDAAEFVPRTFHPTFVPVPFVPDMYGNLVPSGLILPPPGSHFIPGQYYDVEPFYPVNPDTKDEEITAPDSVEDNKEQERNNAEEEVVVSEPPVVPAPVPQKPTNTIDIAKIVSKLEQAALEQKQQEEHDEKVQVKSVKRSGNQQQPLAATQRKSKKPVVDCTTSETNKTEAIHTATTIIQEPEEVSAPAAPTPAPPPPPVELPKPPTFTDKLKSTVNNKKQPSPPAKSICPRLQRIRHRPEVTARTKPNLTPKPSPPPVGTSGAPARDQWISVSSKKNKRNKGKTSVDDEEPPPPVVVQDEIQIVQEEPIKIEVNPEIIVKETIIESVPVPEPEVVVPTETESPKKIKKSKKTRRRIIINDEVFVKEEIKSNEIKEEPEVLVPQEEIIVVNKPVEIPEVVVVDEKPDAKQLKRKKKRSKSVKEELLVPEPEDLAVDTPQVEEAETKTNVEVSQEIDRMIRRGLYANMEEKIRLFNPSDSFIQSASDVGLDELILKPDPAKFSTSFGKKNFDFSGIFFQPTAAAAAPTQTTTKHQVKSDEIAVTTDAMMMIDNTNVMIPVTETLVVSSPIVVEDLPPHVAAATASIAHLQITRAVKEWMDRTRETTPEVEIFKKPNEIREEIRQHVLLPTPDGLLDDLSDSETITTCDDPDLLLECWEPEILPDARLVVDEAAAEVKEVGGCCAQALPIEQGEDALEMYESVYGKNSDYLRIKAEVQQQTPPTTTTTATTTTNATSRSPFGVRDGGLPYRAICCTVM